MRGTGKGNSKEGQLDQTGGDERREKKVALMLLS